jgi:hypothetical protein
VIDPVVVEALRAELRVRARALLSRRRAEGVYTWVAIGDITIGGNIWLMVKDAEGYVLHDEARHFNYVRALDVIAVLRKEMVLDDLARV